MRAALSDLGVASRQKGESAMNARVLVVIVSITLGWGGVSLSYAASKDAASQPAVARYRFVPGQEITYRSNWRAAYWKTDWRSFRTSLTEESMDTTAWVLHANSDGSYRTLWRVYDTTTQTRAGKRQEGTPSTQFIYADVFPDGREIPSRWLTTWGNVPPSLFPPLPPDAAAARVGWGASPQEFRYACTPVESGREFVFDTRIQTPYDKTAGDWHLARYRFDAARGLIARCDEKFTRNGKIQGSGGRTCELLGVKTISPDAIKELAHDSEEYFAAVEAYDSRLQEAAKCEPGDAVPLLATAAAKLKAAATNLQQPEMKQDIGQRLAEHEAAVREILKQDADRTGRVGRPAPDFETVDLNGSSVRLSDFRGKVVVLDFWYRGCGPCILTMPQVNQLADDFAGQPVAIFGMNTDLDPADARFVATQFALKYPTLRARDLSAQFGVEAVPTLIVIDPQGIIRKIHVGYSPTLRNEISALIRQLEEH